MTAFAPAPAAASPDTAPVSEFELVESSAGWLLTVTLTERLRTALAEGTGELPVDIAVRVAPNLVPGEPFDARLRVRDPQAEAARGAARPKPRG